VAAHNGTIRCRTGPCLTGLHETIRYTTGRQSLINKISTLANATGDCLTIRDPTRPYATILDLTRYNATSRYVTIPHQTARYDDTTQHYKTVPRITKRHLTAHNLSRGVTAMMTPCFLRSKTFSNNEQIQHITGLNSTATLRYKHVTRQHETTRSQHNTITAQDLTAHHETAHYVTGLYDSLHDNTSRNQTTITITITITIHKTTSLHNPKHDSSTHHRTKHSQTAHHLTGHGF